MKYRIIKIESGGHTRYIPQHKRWYGWATGFDELDGYLEFSTYDEAKAVIDAWNAPSNETVVWAE